MKRNEFVLAWLAMVAIVPGCTTVPLFNIITPGVGGGILTNTLVSAGQAHGPRVTCVNDSTMALTVRYWVGRRDTTAPRGVADIRTSEELLISLRPGEFAITQAGRPGWPTSMTDAVVRVRVAPTDGTHEPVWIELQQPGPYTLCVTGESFGSIAFHRYGGGDIAPLPREEWIDSNNGPFPVRLGAAAR